MPGRGRLEHHLRALGATLAVFAFAVAPVVATMYFLYLASRGADLAFDFRHAYATGADAVLVGESPFPAANDPALADGTRYVYPPLTAYLVAPFAILPSVVGEWAFTAAMIASVLGALRLVGVCDWRVYGVVFLWPPVQSGLLNANVSLPITLVLALAWRLRTSRVPVGIAVGAAVALKLFLWPLALWVWAACGRRAGAVAGLASATLVLAPWALIGFAGLAGYPELLRALEAEMASSSYSLYAFLLELGTPESVSRAGSIALALGVIWAGVVVGRRGDDRRSLTLIVAGALLGTPLVWMHYFSVLVVVLALARPVLSPLWLAPTLLWGLPMVHYVDPAVTEIAFALGVFALVVTVSVLSRPWDVGARRAAGRHGALAVGGATLAVAGVLAADQLASGLVVGGCLLLAYALSSYTSDRRRLGTATVAPEVGSRP